MKKIVVVGSGFGGLSIASKLKAKKFDVTLIEKHKDLGGRARTFVHNDFKYDAGPTVITAPYLIDELFSARKCFSWALKRFGILDSRGGSIVLTSKEFPDL